MPDVELYDALILGTGEAGKYMAWHLGRTGKRVAVIERKYLGGACPNVACLPSKNVIHTAKVASYFRHGDEFGMRNAGWSVDMPLVRERKRKMVDELLQVHRHSFAASGVEIIMGFGKFVGEKTLEVSLRDGGTRTCRAEMVFLDTGTRATVDEVPGLAESIPLTHIEALELDRTPEHLLIVGGGYVGLEFAQAMRRLGSRITVIERNGRLIHREDPDVSEALGQLFADEEITVETDVILTRVEGACGERVRLFARQRGADILLDGSHVLVAAGRTPN